MGILNYTSNLVCCCIRLKSQKFPVTILKSQNPGRPPPHPRGGYSRPLVNPYYTIFGDFHMLFAYNGSCGHLNSSEINSYAFICVVSTLVSLFSPWWHLKIVDLVNRLLEQWFELNPFLFYPRQNDNILNNEWITSYEKQWFNELVSGLDWTFGK